MNKEDLYIHFGVSEETFNAEELLTALIGSNAESHACGVAGELAFQSAASKEQIRAVKISDNDRSKRYDFEVFSTELEKPIRVECKTAKLNKTFDVNFRDGKQAVCGDIVITTHARHVSEDFDYVAVNCKNLTKKWSDIKYFRFKDLPKAKITNRNARYYISYTETAKECFQNNYITSSIQIEKLPYFENLKDVVEDFKNKPTIL